MVNYIFAIQHKKNSSDFGNLDIYGEFMKNINELHLLTIQIANLSLSALVMGKASTMLKIACRIRCNYNVDFRRNLSISKF